MVVLVKSTRDALLDLLSLTAVWSCYLKGKGNEKTVSTANPHVLRTVYYTLRTVCVILQQFAGR